MSYLHELVPKLLRCFACKNVALPAGVWASLCNSGQQPFLRRGKQWKTQEDDIPPPQILSFVREKMGFLSALARLRRGFISSPCAPASVPLALSHQTCPGEECHSWYLLKEFDWSANEAAPSASSSVCTAPFRRRRWQGPRHPAKAGVSIMLSGVLLLAHHSR